VKHPFLFLPLLVLPFLNASAAPQASLFERLGGKKGVARIADSFVETLRNDKQLLTDPQLKGIETRANKKQVKARLSDEICKATGGPCKPSAAALLADGTQVHLGITQWIEVFQDANQALDECHVTGKERAEMLSLLYQAQSKK
jgi:hemoglobin